MLDLIVHETKITPMDEEIVHVRMLPSESGGGATLADGADEVTVVSGQRAATPRSADGSASSRLGGRIGRNFHSGPACSRAVSTNAWPARPDNRSPATDDARSSAARHDFGVLTNELNASSALPASAFSVLRRRVATNSVARRAASRQVCKIAIKHTALAPFAV
jgi:hypothetical protein